MAYATPAQFIAKFGLEETTQLLQDEERLLTPQLLRDAIADAWTGLPSDDEKAAAASALARLTEQLATTSNLMDGYLRVAVALPLSAGDANVGALRDCCLGLARGGVADDCDNYTEQIGRACDGWTKWLKDIAGGRVQLVNEAGEVPVSTGGYRSGKAKSSFDWGDF